ncbi:MAG TPA: ornithine carbamoyltransferase [Methanoregulaceae archaeon]|nr:ornithine carbamoyltransferase [Methanoregulaceae archaeon]
MKKDLLSFLDISEEELDQLLVEAQHLKKLRKEKVPHELLPRKTLAMIFEKPSTRTRLSFEVGMHDLGGHALYLNSQDLQIGRGEEIRDTARVASRYVSGIMIRAYKHQTIVDFAKYAPIPVINGLSDREHPCQILADVLTIWEHFGSTLDLKIAWVGDANNVCNSLLLSSAITGMIINVAGPPEFQPSEDLVDLANSMGGRVEVMKDPYEAVKDANVIATDTWVSMGEETSRDYRLKAFQGYTIDSNLVKSADPDAIVMHCLPAHRGQEISDEVIEGPQSVVWEEAENRLHAQKALLVRLLGNAKI